MLDILHEVQSLTNRRIKLRDRELQAVSEFPSCIQFNPLDLEDQTVPMLTVSARLFLQQEHLQNMFFVDRLLLRYGYEDKGDLLKISYDLVTLTLPRYVVISNLPFVWKMKLTSCSKSMHSIEKHIFGNMY